jgi:hypothetical protein
LSTHVQRTETVNWKERGIRNKGSYKPLLDRYQAAGRRSSDSSFWKEEWKRRLRRRELKRISTLATEEELERRRSGIQLIWTDVPILAGSSEYILT